MEEEFDVKPWALGALGLATGAYFISKWNKNRKTLKQINRAVDVCKTWQAMQVRIIEMKDDPEITPAEVNQALKEDTEFFNIILNELEEES